MERRWKPNVETSPNCPRCASSNTKFCYYNNYTLTQPRYFCKSCRRYWTKGGSLRNVPVGGGCRKNRRGRLSAPNNADVLGLAPSKTSLHDSTTSSSSMAAPHGSHIDLSLVYANFLNRAHQQPELEIPEFSNPSLEFSSLLDYTYLELDTSVRQLECLNPSRSAMEEIQKDGDGVQQCSAGLDTSNYGLPPLPSYDVPSQRILWSYNSQLPVVGGDAAHQNPNLLIGNWSPFDLANDHAFPGP